MQSHRRAIVSVIMLNLDLKRGTPSEVVFWTFVVTKDDPDELLLPAVALPLVAGLNLKACKSSYVGLKNP